MILRMRVDVSKLVIFFVRCCSKSLASILRVMLWSVEVDISDYDRYGPKLARLRFEGF